MILIILFILLFALALFLQARLRRRIPDAQSIYEKAESLMTPAELAFFRALEESVTGRFRLFSKVRLADLVRIKGADNRGQWQAAFNVIANKHVDFVAVDPSDMSIRFVVELDDRSHRKSSRQSRDEAVDRILTGAGIPVIRFPASSGYSTQQIRSQLLAAERQQ
ncbi:MAG: DUF2726 domain-containing protein [Kiritimatiellae bacterium]|nr:DUF2726 domain-containing protein [Kiritimatiellia bacterium]MDW8459437.1 DUF2726 domain-containing protein [Verrucomicrobiota bacterium]